MKSKKNIKKMILDQKVDTDSKTQDKILAGAFAQLNTIKHDEHRLRQLPFFVILINNRFTQLGAVACLLGAIFFTAYYVDKPINICTIATAQVSENIDSVKSFTYRHRKQTLNSEQNKSGLTETVLYFSPDHGVRLGTYVDGKAEMRTFLLPAEKVMITITPEQKQYKRYKMNEEDMGQIQREKDPRELIRNFLSSNYTDLGCRMISGIQTHELEVYNPDFLKDSMNDTVGRLWVNVKTQLPVRMEFEGIDVASQNKIKIVTDEFRWKPNLRKNDFGPFIPEDYVLNETTSKEGTSIRKNTQYALSNRQLDVPRKMPAN